MQGSAYLTVCALLLLGAADAAGQAKPPGQGADACAVVPKAEIEQTFGVKLSDGVKDANLQTPGVVSTCRYPIFGGAGQVSIAIRRRPIKYEGTATLGAMGVQQGHVQGLGRDALLTEGSAGDTSIETLSIFRGDYENVNIMFMGSSPVKPISAAIEKVGHLVLDGWK